jgi:phosphoribosylanthranilate isomerase
MHVKFCGFTQLADIHAATQSGVDAVGLVLYPPSPRAVTHAQAQVLSAAVPAFVSVVALVVNMLPEQLSDLADNVASFNYTVTKALSNANSLLGQ